MKKSKLKLFPLILMLIAGSIVSIMTWWFQYEIKAALLILLSSLLLFYLLGQILIKIIAYFDRVNEEKRRAEEQAALENEGPIEINPDAEGENADEEGEASAEEQ
ncbi:MAG: hypothetical protein IJP31_02005 [Lachnospiraceae bacterium]|nr:hypothetical protein [Lachnospiraceae bacterium]